MVSIDLAKDEAEHPVPEPWRSKFRQIANAFATGDFQLRNIKIDGVEPVDESAANFFRESAKAYGEDLAPLDDATWESSIYLWMDGYWEFLIDLSTEQAPVSDLSLHAKLNETSGQLHLWSVHVP